MTNTDSRQMFERICEILNAEGKVLTPIEEQLAVQCRLYGEQLVADVLLRLNPAARCLELTSQLPVMVPDRRTTEMALAVCRVNQRLTTEGGFVYCAREDDLYYRTAQTIADTGITPAMIRSMLQTALQHLSRYTHSFQKLAEGELSLGSFD